MRVRLFAAAAEAAGVDELSLDLASLSEFDTLSALEHELDSRFGEEFARIRSQCSVMVDGVRAEGNLALGGASTVDVLPPFAGG